MSDETRTVTVAGLAAARHAIVQASIALANESYVEAHHEIERALAALAALPVATAGPEAELDADGDPIRPDPHSEDWYDGYAEGQRDAALRGAAAQADGGEAGLTEAWAAAVAVLPEGVGLELAKLALDDWAEAVAGDITEQGATPVAALLALAARLTDPTP